jgi:hypothetical protein
MSIYMRGPGCNRRNIDVYESTSVAGGVLKSGHILIQSLFCSSRWRLRGSRTSAPQSAMISWQMA